MECTLSVFCYSKSVSVYSMKAYRNTGTVPLINLGTKMEASGELHALATLPPGKNPSSNHLTGGLVDLGAGLGPSYTVLYPLCNIVSLMTTLVSVTRNSRITSNCMTSQKALAVSSYYSMTGKFLRFSRQGLLSSWSSRFWHRVPISIHTTWRCQRPEDHIISIVDLYLIFMDCESKCLYEPQIHFTGFPLSSYS
jgi:hypothetical protein